MARRSVLLLLIAAALVTAHHALPMLGSHSGHGLGSGAVPALLTCLAAAIATAPSLKRLRAALGELLANAAVPLHVPLRAVSAATRAHDRGPPRPPGYVRLCVDRR